MTDKLYYTYNDIHQIIHNKISKVKEFEPDIILAIGGGGLIPGRILRSYLNKPLFIVSLSSYDGENMNKDIQIQQWINDDFYNKRVLIVDEVDDTRRTLKFCVDNLIKKNNANFIGIFVVHNKIKNKVLLKDVVYYSGENIEDKWIVYPWDIIDNKRQQIHL